MEHACTPMARVLLMHLELFATACGCSCGFALSLGLLVSYTTLARHLRRAGSRWIRDAGRIKRSSVIARIRGKRKPEVCRRFRRHSRQSGFQATKKNRSAAICRPRLTIRRSLRSRKASSRGPARACAEYKLHCLLDGPDTQACVSQTTSTSRGSRR